MAILVSERLDIRLTALYPDFSRSRIKGLIEAGLVKVNGEVVLKPGAKVEESDEFDVTIPPPVPAEPEPEDIPLDIIFEDDDILVVNKAAGFVVHPAPGHNSGTLVNAVLHHCPDMKGIGGVARPGIVHRLDQDTSGVMVIAKSQAAMTALARDFSSHANMRKVYRAIVHGRPEPASGHIENLIGRHKCNRKKMAIVQENGKIAITDYRTLSTVPKPVADNVWEPGSEISLVECDILTGRTHQIRVHMASIGCPIVGDSTYGRKSADRTIFPPAERQMLHAFRLELRHPVTRKPIAFEAPMPECFLRYMGART
jgi:23S rRNA pseudouridine1911/1915/1917 synthase